MERETHNFFAMEKKEEGASKSGYEKDGEACLRLLLELLFDRITKEEMSVLQEKLLGHSGLMVTHIFEKKYKGRIGGHVKVAAYLGSWLVRI